MNDAPQDQGLPPLTATRIHHVGYAVASLDRALEFWEALLGVERLWRQMLDRPYLGKHVGYPGVKIDAAFVPLPGGVILELLEYQLPGLIQNPEETANPGNAHICLAVENAESAWKRAVALGARPVAPDGPVDVDGGPNKGARATYLRIHDGITLEMIQPPPSR
jgi:catechol 2,3-dioxygenase-like lactoylglutathione lyase family enzyme